MTKLKKHMRMFVCSGECKMADGRPYYWWERKVPDKKPVSECPKCKIECKAVPRGEEWGIGRCKFECESCHRKFTALCEMSDKAKCYGCHETISPFAFSPPNWPQNKSVNNRKGHSCTKCQNLPIGSVCPNLKAFKEISHKK